MTLTIQNFFITYNVGHGAGTKISANNIGPGAVGRNNNRGTGAGGCNSGDHSGAVNYSNWEGNQVVGGSSGRVQRGRFDQRRYLVCGFPDRYDEKRFKEIFSGYGAVSSIYIRKSKGEHGNRIGYVTFLELPDEEGMKKLYESHGFRVYRKRPRRRTIRNRAKTEGNMGKSFANGFSGCMWVPKEGHDAVERRDKTKIIEFKTKEEKKAGLDFCAVGRIRELKDILPRVKRYLHEQGFSFCKVVDGRLDVEQSNGDSSDKGFQENDGSESHKYQHELGSQNVVSSTNTLNTGAKPLWPTKKLNAEGNPFRPANQSFPLICNGKEVSDKEPAVVNGRSEGELSDGSLDKGDERERRDEEIFTRNRRSEFNGNSECNVQTALQTCSLGSKQGGCGEGDGEICSSDKGFQEIVTSEPQKDHPGESGSQNFSSDTSSTIGNGDAGDAGSRDLMVEGNIDALHNFRSGVDHYQCQKEISIIRKRDVQK